MLKTLYAMLQGVLKSRKIFSNWLSAALHYALINSETLYKTALYKTIYKQLPDSLKTLGKAYINIKCRNGGKVRVDSVLYGYVIRGFDLGFIREVKCDEKDDALIINGLMIKLKYNGDYFDLGSAKFKRIYFTILQTFAKQEYGLIDVSNRVVVDVGAFVGDTAIYFALRGARRVYAIEPHPGAYAEMLENIKLNNMESKIVPINAALGSKPGKIRIMDSDVANTISVYHGPESSGNIEIPMVTLDQLINDYDIEPDILKMDCEGCEFDVILNDYEHVKLFKELIFEYHDENNRELPKLLNKLKTNYTCKAFGGWSTEILYCAKKI